MSYWDSSFQLFPEVQESATYFFHFFYAVRFSFNMIWTLVNASEVWIINSLRNGFMFVFKHASQEPLITWQNNNTSHDCTSFVSDELVLIQLLPTWCIHRGWVTLFFFLACPSRDFFFFFQPWTSPAHPLAPFKKKIPTYPAPLPMLQIFFLQSSLSFCRHCQCYNDEPLLVVFFCFVYVAPYRLLSSSFVFGSSSFSLCVNSTKNDDELARLVVIFSSFDGLQTMTSQQSSSSSSLLLMGYKRRWVV